LGFLEAVSRVAGRYFALLVVAGAVLAFFLPSLAGITGYINILLGVVMFGMGLTLTGSDFLRVLREPRGIFLGVLAQFTIMPLVAFALAYLLDLPPQLAAGVILLGCCPGGTASNVITYLARGDVPLSVSMTSVSTVLAPLVTPLLMLVLAGSWLPVDALALFVSIVQVVLVPVLLGVLINTFFRRQVERVVTVLPLVSVAVIILIVMGVIAASSESLLTVGPLVFLVVVLHNLLGLLLGYFAARSLRMNEAGSRTVSIEVGMQNSGLAAALATAHFSPVAALPGAIFSVWHNISGPSLATYWRRRPVGDSDRPTDVPA